MTTVLMVWDLKPEGSELWREIGGQRVRADVTVWQPWGAGLLQLLASCFARAGSHACSRAHSDPRASNTQACAGSIQAHIHTWTRVQTHMRGRSQSVAQAYCWLRSEAGPAKSL